MLLGKNKNKLKNIKFFFRLFIPEKNKILIFDEEGSEDLVQYVLPDLKNTKVYDLKVFTIYFNINFILKFLKNLMSTYVNDFSFIKKIYIIYIKTEIEFIDPQIIITYNDDNCIYHDLTYMIKNRVFIAIQNGLRERFIRDRIKHSINHDYLYCFGLIDRKKNTSTNWIVKNLRPVGSLRAGIALSKFNSFKKQYDICLISEYEPRKKNDPDNHHWNDHWLFVTEIMAELLKKRNYRIIVALNGHGGIRERDYFQSILPSNAVFTNLNTKLDSYRAIMESDVTVGFCSTLLLESLALNSKVLQINTAQDNSYFEFDSKFIHEYSQIDKLEKRIDELISIPYDSYRKSIKNFIPEYMNIDKKNLPQAQINQNIKDILLN